MSNFVDYGAFMSPYRDQQRVAQQISNNVNQLGAGIGSIAKPTVTADLLGSTNFGAISAMVSIAHMLGFAFGPALSGLIWSVTDYDTVIKVTGTLALIGVCSLFIAQKPSRN